MRTVWSSQSFFHTFVDAIQLRRRGCEHCASFCLSQLIQLLFELKLRHYKLKWSCKFKHPILTRMNEGSESKALHLYDSTATASPDITRLSCKHKAWIRWLCKCWCMNHIKSYIKHHVCRATVSFIQTGPVTRPPLPRSPGQNGLFTCSTWSRRFRRFSLRYVSTLVMIPSSLILSFSNCLLSWV